MQGLLIIKVSTFQWWKATLKINVQLTLLLAEKMERSCEGLQNQLWKPSVSLVGGESCKTKPPLVNPRSLNSWLAVDKIRGTSLMRRPPELHVLLNTYLQVFCLFPYQENRLSNPDLKLQGSSSQEDLSVWAMAHPRRDQVPSAVQCGFYSRFFVSQRMLLTLLYESGQWDTGRLNGDTKVTHFGRGWS